MFIVGENLTHKIQEQQEGPFWFSVSDRRPRLDSPIGLMSDELGKWWNDTCRGRMSPPKDIQTPTRLRLWTP